MELNNTKNHLDFFPVKAPDDNSILIKTLITFLWHPKQKTQLSCAQIPNPHKLWDKNVVLSS